MVKCAILQVLAQIDGAQVADRSFDVGCVERDLGAQVAGVHHAGVLLRRSDVAGILERDPGMPGFEQHGQHLAPKIAGLNGAVGLDFSARSFLLIDHIGILKRCSKQVVQVRHAIGGEKRPDALFHHAAHKQIGNPVCRVHIVGTAAVIPCVLAQLHEFFNVKVPRFQVGADGTFTLAALINCHGCIVDHLQERHHTLRFSIGAFDVCPQGSHTGPVVAKSASVLGQQRVFLDGFVNAVQVVRNRCQVAR